MAGRKNSQTGLSNIYILLYIAVSDNKILEVTKGTNKDLVLAQCLLLTVLR